MHICCVNGCTRESYPGSGLSFHRIPKDENVAAKWREVIPGKISKTSAVCNLHFNDDDFVNVFSRKRLKGNAVPSIFPKILTPHKLWRAQGSETGLPSDNRQGLWLSVAPLDPKFYSPSNLFVESDDEECTESGVVPKEEVCSDEATHSLHEEPIKEKPAIPIVRIIPLSKEILMKYSSRHIEKENDKKQNIHDTNKLRVCKLCLRIDAKMFDLNEETLNKMYIYVIGIEPRTDSKDRFPMNICWECKARLHAAAAFKCKALTSDQLMQEHLDSHEELNITEIQNLYQEHNLKSSLAIDEIETFNCESETHINTESDPLVKTETIELTFDEDLDDNSEINEIVIKNENKISDDETDAELEIITNNSQDSFQCDAPKVNWDNILLVKTPTVADNQFNITVFDNDAKMADMNDTNDDCFDTNTDDGAEKIVVNNTVKRKTRKMDTSKNRWIVPQENAYGIPIDETVFTVKSLSQERLIEEVMARKNSARYLRAPYKCTVCFKGFLRKDKLERHSMKHSEKAGPLKCVICKVRMKLGSQMKKHMRRLHTSEFICKLCPLVTRHRDVALAHVKYHGGTKFICPQCGVQFDKKTTMLSHLRLKHMSDCVCELCGYTFVGDNGVRAHKRFRHKFDDKNQPLDGPHCEVCDVQFLNQKAYETHLRLSSKHLQSEDDPNRLFNDSSKKTRKFDDTTAFDRRCRLWRQDADRFQTIACEQCGVHCGGVAAYKWHFRRAHPGLGLSPAQFTQVERKPFMCEHCGKMFAHKVSLENHTRVHTGKKQFQCDVCSKRFSVKFTLIEHIKHHDSNYQPIECRLCGKQFAYKNNMIRHLRIHTGDKPFKCGVCEKAFAAKCDLQAHVKHVHLNVPRPKRVRQRPKKSDASLKDRSQETPRKHAFTKGKLKA